MLLKSKLKRIIASALFGDPHQFLTLRKMRDKTFILMYHRVLYYGDKEQVFVQPGIYVSQNTFRKHIEFLKTNFKILFLDELLQRIENGKNIDGCCSITFDDGWNDNFTNAYPVIKEYQVPATIFLATNYIGNNKVFWPEELCFYLKLTQNKWEYLPKSIKKQYEREIISKINEDKLLDNIIENVKKLNPDERENILEKLRIVSPIKSLPKLLIDWNEARIMVDSGLINFGAHTANHVILDQVSLQQAEQEIVQSRQHIEDQLGIQVNYFAYPNGNFNKDIKKLLKRIGFKGAVTTQKKLIDEKVSLFEIPRIGMHDDVSNSIPLFIARILTKRF